MVGIIIVSHSSELAEGLLLLANRLAQDKIRIAAAGGANSTDDPVGTDTIKILEAIKSVYSDEGVIVFFDMGSAVQNTEKAIEFLDEKQRLNIHISDAPLAEGVLSAAITASTGASLPNILEELDEFHQAKKSLLRPPASSVLTGNRINGGIVIAPVFHFTNTLQDVPRVISDNSETEKKRIKDAVKAAAADLKALISNRNSSISDKEAEIFKAHRLIINDPELLAEVYKLIDTESLEAACAWRQVIITYIDLYKNSRSNMLAERAADVLDAGQRVLSIITGVPAQKPNPTEPVILVAEELSPSDTAELNPELISGVICERGSDTSHSGILVRSLGIPTIFGVKGALKALQNGKTCILDADLGKIYPSPSDKLITQMSSRRESWLKSRELAGKVRHRQVTAAGGEQIEVLANVSEPKHVEKALEEGAEGIGLYRTEFLYMNRSEAPSEQEQYEVYRHALETMKGMPVTFRTIDVGGDKPVRYLSIEKEENPFMGWRGIRFSLEKSALFKTQLRAMLRASAHGKAKIMFPMVATLEEFRRARKAVENAMSELVDEGLDFDSTVPLGIMVEVPSAAIRIKDFLSEIDFASIGTNDLTQYIMAADRMNNKVTALASYNQSAVIDVIANVIKDCNEKDVEISMCGEMARDIQVTQLLLDFGLRSFSMSASGIPEFKLHLLDKEAQPK